MTDQLAEIFLDDGVERDMLTEPLESYFEMGGHRPEWPLECTGLWRGYQGRWRVVEGRLYLMALSGMFLDSTHVNLEQVFPGYPNGVFAHWFSGPVRLPHGKRLGWESGGFGCIYERDEFLIFERGVLTRKLLRENGMGAMAWSDASIESANDPEDDEIDEARGFVVKPRHLLRRMTVAEIEAAELVCDPLGTVPRIPFGHLNGVWETFVKSEPKGAEIWSFSAKRRDWGRTNLLSGYAWVQAGEPANWIAARLTEGRG